MHSDLKSISFAIANNAVLDREGTQLKDDKVTATISLVDLLPILLNVEICIKSTIRHKKNLFFSLSEMLVGLQLKSK